MRTNYGNSCKHFIWTKLKGQKSTQNILYHYCSDYGTSLFSVSQSQSTLVPLLFFYSGTSLLFLILIRGLAQEKEGEGGKKEEGDGEKREGEQETREGEREEGVKEGAREGGRKEEGEREREREKRGRENPSFACLLYVPRPVLN